MRIFVTGATGFVGQALCRALLNRGDEVVAFVRDEARAKDLVEAGATLRTGTLADPNDIAAAAEGCEVAFHAAGIGAPQSAARAINWVNIAGTENVLNGARHAGVRRFVHLSCTDATLADIDRVHWDEDKTAIGQSLGVLARSKQLSEELVIAESGGGIECVAVRPAYLWGPGDTSNLPGLVRRGGARLIGSGDNLFCTTYIDNLIDALLLSATAEKAPSRIYHVPDAEFLDAKEFFTALCGAVGLPRPRSGLPYGLAYARAGLFDRVRGSENARAEVVRMGRNTRFDGQRAMTELEWEPNVSLAKGLDALKIWVDRVGGLDGVATLHRAPADAASVDAQARAAG